MNTITDDVSVIVTKRFPNQDNAERWGACKNKVYYVLEIKEIIDTYNLK